MNPMVAVIMGSASDWEIVKEAVTTLKKFEIPVEAHVMSAHRTPDIAAEFARNAESKGIKVIIAAAGGAAHLAGVISAHTTLPVIGIPIPSVLNGLDSLLSIVQMPGGIPVATMAIGKAGAVNAAIFAAQILAISDHNLQTKLKQHKESLKQTVLEGDSKIQAELNK
ncbi:MAG: 5-(carboxyamino)imidazole ribonucleotide mutase [Verrucomicrobiae bacterium]|nr:5-(carboxyamino)imidazole ribonucleotide mutase [Verrucomicrobiae bacterium]